MLVNIKVAVTVVFCHWLTGRQRQTGCLVWQHSMSATHTSTLPLTGLAHDVTLYAKYFLFIFSIAAIFRDHLKVMMYKTAKNWLRSIEYKGRMKKFLW